MESTKSYLGKGSIHNYKQVCYTNKTPNLHQRNLIYNIPKSRTSMYGSDEKDHLTVVSLPIFIAGTVSNASVLQYLFLR
jgi:hypothetical protein